MVQVYLYFKSRGLPSCSLLFSQISALSVTGQARCIRLCPEAGEEQHSVQRRSLWVCPRGTHPQRSLLPGAGGKKGSHCGWQRQWVSWGGALFLGAGVTPNWQVWAGFIRNWGRVCSFCEQDLLLVSKCGRSLLLVGKACNF